MRNNALPSSTRPPGRKAQLLRIASELFASKGYPNVSVAQITSAAGVTPPSIYRHFSDKQAILGEAVLDAIHRLEEITTPELTFKEFVLEVTSAIVGRPDLAVLWRWGIVHLEPEWQKVIRDRSKTLLDRWTTGIRRLRPDLHPVEARLIARAMISAASSAIIIPGKLSLTKHVHTLAGTLIRIAGVSFPNADEQGWTTTVHSPAPDNRRDQLLAAASQLFLSRGFAAVGVEELGASVGISGPSVYRHFPDKQALFAAVCLRGVHRLAAQVDTELAQIRSDDAKSRLQALARAHVHVLLTSHDLSVAIGFGTVELTGAPGIEVRVFLRAHFARWIAILVELHDHLSPAQAKVIVYSTITMANDLARTPTFLQRPHCFKEMLSLVSQVLDIVPCNRRNSPAETERALE